MLKRLLKAFWVALFACLVLGYVSLVWYASQAPGSSQYERRTYHTNEKAGQRNPPQTLWEWVTHDAIAVFTFFLAAFTGALFWVSIIEMRYLRRADKTARKLAKITKQQTAILAAQADIALKQHELERLQFIADKRPRLRIRNVVVRPASVTGYEPTLFHPGQYVGGQCYIANSGGIDAVVVEAHCEVFVTNVQLPMERPYEGKNGNSAIRPTIPPGGSVPFPFQSDTIISEHQSQAVRNGIGYRLYLLGWVEYEDIKGVRRRTAFCRKYDAATGRFAAVDDPDYEHEE